MQRWFAGAITILLIGAGPVTPGDAEKLRFDAWRNPSGSVHVQAFPCDNAICGQVIWANEKARQDVARAGSGELIGMVMFRDFQYDGSTAVRGRVFVPDIRRTFSGTATLTGPDTLRARGCLTGRVGCRSQEWTRIPRDQLSPAERAEADRLAPRP